MSRAPPAMLEDTGAICGWLMSSKTESYALPNLRTPHFAMRLSRFDLRSEVSRSQSGKGNASCG